ncbi:GNAT family N-acetyltransferase [Hymenobacter tibetensis]|uniref:GNAT family N-acetyltransferase n=1 Tax=Hymenobacter tibetensis TaxID=497967 RepID=A0ABY4CSN6_9BACT|nr:GNAT family N-acetyltransferase [Hymenobacter tibetensis]UOG73057.1 GNAT family N-acetyltransferase [Hymenobacter tibetensis]
MTTIRKVESGEAHLLASLREVLLDSIAGGASVGFLADTTPAEADAYWDSVFSSLGPGLALWVAEEEDGTVVGTIQLSLVLKTNGIHRAEVQKLQVLQVARGKGIASQLLATVEVFARQHNRSLLVLDTIADSPAAAMYHHLGWQKAGEIPRYAANPDGSLHATAYYYKEL